MLSDLVIVLSLITSLGLIVPYTGIAHWLISGQEYIKAFYAIIGVCLLPSYFLIGEFGFLECLSFAILLFAVFISGMKIFPFTKFHRKLVPQIKIPDRANTLRILICNVYQPNQEYMALIELIKENTPDLIFLFETNKRWDDAMLILKDDYPYSIKSIQEDTYGLICYSKIKCEEATLQFINKNKIPSVNLLIHVNGNRIRVLGLHPEPPAPGEASSSDPKDRELIRAAVYLAKRQEEGEHTLLVGDLNDVAWSRTSLTFRKISGMTDPRIGRGFYATFPAYFYFKIPLDHVFCSNKMGLVDYRTLDNIGSDHLPVLTEIQIMES